MDANDVRHGSQAGRSQHIRDNEDPCSACLHGDQIAARRRRKRRQMGVSYTLPLGQDLYDRLTELRDQGASYHKLAEWAGVGFRSVYGAIQGGPEARVYTRTHEKLSALRAPARVTNVGLTRRVQALQRLGYSLPVVSKETGVSAHQLREICNGRQMGVANHRVREAIAAAFDRLEFTVAPTDTTSQRKSATHARNRASRHGWVSPLAWVNIDDPAERPARSSDRSGPARDSVDPVVVARILAGDWLLDSTKAEKFEVMRLWIAAGKSEKSLCARTGWKDSRYREAS